jgi:hypothetical protein
MQAIADWSPRLRIRHAVLTLVVDFIFLLPGLFFVARFISWNMTV